MSLVEEQARAIVRALLDQRDQNPGARADSTLSRARRGETSDIVEKQMYTFTDRDEGETMVALRPEGTPAWCAHTSKPGSIAAILSSGFSTRVRCFVANARRRDATGSFFSSASKYLAAPMRPATPNCSL